MLSLHYFFLFLLLSWQEGAEVTGLSSSLSFLSFSLSLTFLFMNSYINCSWFTFFFFLSSSLCIKSYNRFFSFTPTVTCSSLCLSFKTESASRIAETRVSQFFYYLYTSDNSCFLSESWWRRFENYSSSWVKWGFHCLSREFLASFFYSIWVLIYLILSGETGLSGELSLDFFIRWYFLISLSI